jgi:hypothetical protein
MMTSKNGLQAPRWCLNLECLHQASRVPTAGSDYWWVSYPHRSIEANISCRKGLFQEFEFYDYSFRTPVNVVSNAQTYQLLAASVYAHTGWPSREVLKGVSDLLESAKTGRSNAAS